MAFFQRLEDAEVRGDEYEGSAVYRPCGGLEVNVRDGRGLRLQDGHGLEKTADLENIYIFCASTRLNSELWERFCAAYCIEILDVKAFCQRVIACLPHSARFPIPQGRPANATSRLGNRVIYYDPAQPSGVRSSLPDIVAISKRRQEFSWQSEYRLAFTLNDAFGFENLKYQIAAAPPSGVSSRQNDHFPVKVGSIHRIARLVAKAEVGPPS